MKHYKDLTENNSIIWSIYFDFLFLFKDLVYKGVPLALCGPQFEYFRFFKDDLLKQNLENQDFIINKNMKNTQVQPFLNHYLEEAKKKYQNPIEHPTKEHILLYLVTPGVATNKYKPIQVSHKLSYENHMNDKIMGFVSSMQGKAREIFSSLRNDPIFCNHPIVKIPAIEQHFLNSLPVYIGRIETTLYYLKNYSIASVIMGYNTATWDRIFCILAKLNNIPSIYLQHGLIGPNNWIPIFSNVQTLYGEYEKMYYQKEFGVPENQLKITGHPAFDSIFSLRGNRDNFNLTFKLDPNKKNILFLTQAIGSEKLISYEFLDQLCHIFSKFSANVLFKPHNHEVSHSLLDDYRKLEEKYPFVQLIMSNTNGLIINSDLIINYFSTSGIQALLADKSTIFLSNSPIEGMNCDYPITLNNATPQEVSETAYKLLYDGHFIQHNANERNRFLSRSYPIKDSAQALKHVIQELTEQ